MHKLVILAVVAGCSTSTPTKPSPAPAMPPTAVAATAADVATLFTPAVTGIMRSRGHDFPVVEFVSSLVPDAPPCWPRLRAAITTGYQLEVEGGGSYFVLEGALPVGDVERCAAEAFADVLPVEIRRDGEFLVVDAGTLGTLYAAWRGPAIIAGTKAQVAAAVAVNDPALAATWRARLAELPTSWMAAWRADRLLELFFGVPTIRYLMAFDAIAKGPPLRIAGRLIAQYATDADATEAEGRLRRGEVTATPPALTAAFMRMKVARTGTSLEIAFDQDTFAGVDLAVLQQWIANLSAQVAAP